MMFTWELRYLVKHIHLQHVNRQQATVYERRRHECSDNSAHSAIAIF